MKKEIIESILEIENQYFQIESKAHATVSYKKIGFFYIRMFSFPFELIRELNKINSIRKFGSFNSRAWLIWMIGNFRKKKIQIKSLYNLSGVYASWFFLPILKFPFKADFFYNRGRITTLLYPNIENPIVLKMFLLSDKGSNSYLEKESEILKSAGSIRNKKVKTPRFISYHRKEKLEYFTQTYINARSLGSISVFKKKKIYLDLFDFMIDFYQKNKINLIAPENSSWKNENVVFYLESFPEGKILLRNINSLVNQNKKMINVMLHNDLFDNNILIDKNKIIWVIDWGNAVRGNLVRDFSRKSFKWNQVFDKVVISECISQSEIYNLKEQVLIDQFFETCDMIRQLHKGGKNRFYKYRIQRRIKRLSKRKIIN